MKDNNLIHTYVCQHFQKENGIKIKFTNYIYAESTKEANQIMNDLKNKLNLIDPSIIGTLIEVINFNLVPIYISSVDLTPYFIFYQLDKIKKYSLLPKNKILELKNTFEMLEEYEILSILKNKYLI